MNKFTRGLEPREAMNTGWRCKKQYNDDICSTCDSGIFNWRPNGSLEDNYNRNYCELEYWGIHPSKNI